MREVLGQEHYGRPLHGYICYQCLGRCGVPRFGPRHLAHSTASSAQFEPSQIEDNRALCLVCYWSVVRTIYFAIPGTPSLLSFLEAVN